MTDPIVKGDQYQVTRLVAPGGSILLLHLSGEQDDHMLEVAAELHHSTRLPVFVMSKGTEVEVVHDAPVVDTDDGS